MKKQKTVPAIKLEIACGQRKEQGWVGIDRAKTAQADIIHDLNKYPWPVADDSVEEARCSHYIEHIPQLCLCCSDQVDPLFRFFDELHRIMKVGAKCLIVSPYWSSPRCWQDPTHRRAICEHTFLYANKGWRKANGLDHYQIGCDFDFTYGYILTPETAARAQEVQTFWVQHYTGTVSDVQVTLIKRPLA